MTSLTIFAFVSIIGLYAFYASRMLPKQRESEANRPRWKNIVIGLTSLLCGFVIMILAIGLLPKWAVILCLIPFGLNFLIQSMTILRAIVRL